MSRPVHPGHVAWDCPLCHKSFDLPQAAVGFCVTCPFCRQGFAAVSGQASATRVAEPPDLPSAMAPERPAAQPWLILGAVLLLAGLAGGIVLLLCLSGGVSTEKAEQVVRDHILRSTLNRDEVRFLKWGPHMTRSAVVAWMKSSNQEPREEVLRCDIVIRVQYQVPSALGFPEFHDRICFVRGDKVILDEQNRMGDFWDAEARKHGGQ